MGDSWGFKILFLWCNIVIVTNEPNYWNSIEVYFDISKVEGVVISFRINDYLRYYVERLNCRKSFKILRNYLLLAHDNSINLNFKRWEDIILVEFALCGSNNIVPPLYRIVWLCRQLYNTSMAVLRNCIKRRLLTLHQLTISLPDYNIP